MKKYLEFKDEKSSKFWQIELCGDSFTVKYGKIGTTGTEQIKSFSCDDEAKKEALKIYNSKIKNGYKEVGITEATESTGTNDKTNESTIEKTTQSTKAKINENNGSKSEKTVSKNSVDKIKYYEFKDQQSAKFWCIGVKDEALLITYGKIGTKGQVQEKSFDSHDDANKEAEKLIKSKNKSGYVESVAPTSVVDGYADFLTDEPKEYGPKIVSPEPKKHILPSPPANVRDIGQKIEIPKYYDYDEYESHFAIDLLRTPEVIDVKPKKTSAAKAVSTKEFDAEVYSDAITRLTRIVRRTSGNFVGVLGEALATNPPKDILLKDLTQVTKKLFDAYTVSTAHIELTPLLIDHGVNVVEVCKKSDIESYDFYKFILSQEPNITGDEMRIAIDNYFIPIYTEATDIAIGMLQNVFNVISSGKATDSIKLPEASDAVSVDIEIYSTIYIRCNEKSCASIDFSKLKNVDDSVALKYVPNIIKPQLEKLANEGFLASIDKEYVSISMYDSNGESLVKYTDPKKLAVKAEKLAKELTYLEGSTDFIANVDRLKAFIDAYMSENGIIDNKDTDSILTLLKRYLYSGEELPEVTARDLIYKHRSYDEDKWVYEYTLHSWENCEFDWCINRMGMDSLADYPPAIAKLKEWKAFMSGSKSENASESSSEIDYEEIYGYGDASRKAKHRDTFTEEDVFCETDTMIARAMSNGYIWIRFKEESEQGYSDALDYLNKLMKKGYSNVHDGYDLHVRFLTDKLFFDDLKALCESYAWSDNDSSAFFTKAVHYPALRDKVAEFANLTLNEYDRYLNLDGELSTVAGTFAAAAVALADVKYLPVAIKFAMETDGEHEELASNFSDVLDTYYGVTPETAPAIAMLRLSYDHDDLGLSDDFLKYPENLRAVMDCIDGANLHFRTQKIMRFVNNLSAFDRYDVKGTLRAIKKEFDKLSNPEDKMILADFYNWFLEAAEEEEEESYGKSISYKLPKVESKPFCIGDEDFTENPPCITTPKELKARGYKDNKDIDDEFEKKWLCVYFSPVYFTNPYELEAYYENFYKSRGNGITWYYSLHPTTAFVLDKNIAVDLQGAAYQCGMVIYDKKSAYILYGILDYDSIAKALSKKTINVEQIMKLREKYFIMSGPKGSPMTARIEGKSEGVTLLDDFIMANYKEHYMRALMKLNKITPEMGEDYYVCALIHKTHLLAKKKDNKGLRETYQKLAQLKPMFKEFWDEKLKLCGL